MGALIHLQEAGGDVSKKDLVALVGIDGSSLVRLLDILTERGLIERRMEKNDRRTRLVFLTPAGCQAVQGIRVQLLQAETAMLSDLSDDEITTILDAFDKVDRRLAMARNQPAGAA